MTWTPTELAYMGDTQLLHQEACAWAEYQRATDYEAAPAHRAWEVFYNEVARRGLSLNRTET